MTVFDQLHSRRSASARQEPLRRLLPELKHRLALGTALDAGCGVGYFSSLLHDQGLRVTAFDGRRENAEEAARRLPEIQFHVGDVEDAGILGLGTFDVVLCFGLLYHLENPFRALRHLAGLTNKVLFLESMCVPQSPPSMHLRDEPRAADQSLTPAAFYPSEACLVKMCYQAGFPYVFRFRKLPDHEDFRDTLWRKRARTMLAASKVPLSSPELAYVEEPRDAVDPWLTASGKLRERAQRLVRFVRKPWRDKFYTIGFRWITRFPRIPFPLRLPSGEWWLTRNDACGHGVLRGDFETSERYFVERFLQPGMHVIDIGAHHGLYTLLASRKTGPQGRVVAFEPSPRERKKLGLHLRLNRCSNVQVRPVALGSEAGQGELFLVEGRETGCNSLRPPNVVEPTRRLRVAVETLDSVLEQENIQRVDFIKLDAEGAELDVLKGASELLRRTPRPVVLCEVQEIRTAPWGYRGKEMIRFLGRLGFRWFRPLTDGGLEALSSEQEEFDGTFVAVPEERLEQVIALSLAIGRPLTESLKPELVAHATRARGQRC